MSLNDEWEKFDAGPNLPRPERLHVTINKDGLIYLNKKAHQLLGRPEAVQLYFNRTRSQIALKPAHARLADAFPVKPKPDYYLIHASPFCRHYNIRLSTTEKFAHPEIDDDGILRLDLRSTITVRNRK